MRKILFLALLVASAAVAQPALRFETTLPFSEGKRAPLDAKIGPLRVTSATFSVPQRGSGDKGLMSRIRGELRGPTETESLVRLQLEAENPEAQEWELTVTVDLLDGKGALIDRFSKSASLEGEAKTIDADHPVLTYVVPSISRATVRLEAKLD